MVDGDPVNGKFNDAAPIPVTMGTEHLLSVTIEFGAMTMSYDFTDTSEANNYGWGKSFNGENNKITITNNSTCNVYAIISLNIDTETYPCLKEDYILLNDNNDSSHGNSASANEQWKFLRYAGCTAEGAETSYDTYLISIGPIYNYNFNNAKIGEITITLTPVFETILTEEGYYVKVTEVSDPEELLNVFSYEEALSIAKTVYSGIPYYFGPYATEDEANSIKTQLDESSTCSIIQI